MRLQGNLLSYITDTVHGKSFPLVEKLFERIEEEHEDEWLRRMIEEVIGSGEHGREGD